MLSRFPALNLLDFPERYEQQRKRLPYPTGVVPVAISVPFVLYAQNASSQSLGIVAAVLGLALFAFLDDRRGLPVVTRLVVQVAVGLVVFVTGTFVPALSNLFSELIGGGPLVILDNHDVVLPLLGAVPLWSGVFTVCWLLVTINALNWFDGVPGQVSTVACSAFLTIGFLAVSERGRFSGGAGQESLTLMCFALAAIAAACMLFELPPPRGLTGDTGAMFYGLMIGVLSIHSGAKVATAFLVAGVPVVDSVIVLMRRLSSRRSPFRGNRPEERVHLHHRLEHAGWSPRAIVWSTSLPGLMLGLASIFVGNTGKLVLSIVLVLIVAAWSRLAGGPETSAQILDQR